MNVLGYYSPYLPYTFIPLVLVGLYFYFEEFLKQRQVRWLWWIFVFIVVASIGWYAGYNQGWFDFFKGYYHAGRKLFRNPDVLYDEYCYGYVNFPLLAYIFVPLSELPKEIAGNIFFVIGYLSLIPFGYLLIKSTHLTSWKMWLMIAILALNGPLDYSIKMGNTTHMIALTMLVAIFCYQRGREWLAGILLGINGLIKIPLIIPAGYFLVRRRWKVVGGGILVAGLVLTASLLIIPYSLNYQWVNSCILGNAGNPMAAFNNQSVVGFLARAIIPESHFFEWIPITPPPAFKLYSIIALSVIILPTIIVIFYKWLSNRSSSETTLEFSIVLVCSILISPISWTHYFAFLLIPTAYYLGGEFGQNPGKWHNLLFGVSLLLLSFPLNLTIKLFEQSNQSVFLSIHFFGGLLFYLVLLFVWAKEKFSFKQDRLLAQ